MLLGGLIQVESWEILQVAFKVYLNWSALKELFCSLPFDIL